MVDAVTPSNLQFEVSIINGDNAIRGVGTFSLTTGFSGPRVFQEVVGANNLTASGNKLLVKVLSGGGTLIISDIVLLYLIN